MIAKFLFDRVQTLQELWKNKGQWIKETSKVISEELNTVYLVGLISKIPQATIEYNYEVIKKVTKYLKYKLNKFYNSNKDNGYNKYQEREEFSNKPFRVINLIDNKFWANYQSNVHF